MKRTSLRLEAPQRDVDGSDFELSESPEQDPATINTPENEEDALVIPAKTTRLSSRERSSSSETQAWAASTTLEPAAAEQVGRVTEKSVMALKEKKLEKRPSATRRSLSRRVKRQCPPRDVPSFLKPQLSQEESAISLDSESQDSPKEESPLLKVIQYFNICLQFLLFFDATCLGTGDFSCSLSVIQFSRRLSSKS